MKKKTTLLLLCLLVAATDAVRAQVEWLPDTPNDQFFCAAHPEPGIVYLAGNQAIYKSSDNGDSWAAVHTFDTAFPARFFGMWFWDEQTGFATCTEIGKSASWLIYGVTSLPCLYKTVDGGETWQCIDTLHHFTDVQFVSIDTLFARDSHDRNLYKSVDGGVTWGDVLAECELSDFSVVNGNIIYALHETSYLTNDYGITTHPNPIVYKTSDGGDTWVTIRPADSSRGPRVMDQIFFYEDGKGVILGHDVVYTENDFSTFETASAGFPSAPDGWNLQNCTMKSGFQITTSWDDMDMSGASDARLSRDFGLHNEGVSVINPPGASFMHFYLMCDLSGCEADTTFFIVTLYDVFRVKGSDFPNVGVALIPENKLNVVPNPIVDKFTISSEVPFSRIEVYDMHGRVVYAQLFEMQNEMSVSTINWKSGTYLLRIYTKKGVFNNKIIKR